MVEGGSGEMSEFKQQAQVPKREVGAGSGADPDAVTPRLQAAALFKLIHKVDSSLNIEDQVTNEHCFEFQ